MFDLPEGGSILNCGSYLNIQQKNERVGLLRERQKPVPEDNQFLDLSTSWFAVIHGIISRNLEPTCSI